MLKTLFLHLLTIKYNFCISYKQGKIADPNMGCIKITTFFTKKFYREFNVLKINQRQVIESFWRNSLKANIAASPPGWEDVRWCGFLRRVLFVDVKVYGLAVNPPVAQIWKPNFSYGFVKGSKCLVNLLCSFLDSSQCWFDNKFYYNCSCMSFNDWPN